MTDSLQRNILVLEINEVPWKLIDRFKSDLRFPNIKKYFSSSKTFTTYAVDSGELHPWVTWPTIHRGINNEKHEIKFFGQDVSTFKGIPIWEEFRKKDLSIGICGSLQSWPPINPGKGGFYIPDIFAHDEKCIPSYIEPLQKFGQYMLSKSGRVVNEGAIFNFELLFLLLSLPRLGISMSTLIKALTQVVMELLDHTYLERRQMYQTILMWDVFKSLYKVNNPPIFSTFFTNHLANAMHRYWQNIFPEEFSERYSNKPKCHYGTMIFALDIVDNLLKDAMSFCKQNPNITLVFATSMGQDKRELKDHEGYEASIVNVHKLFNLFNIRENDYKVLLAMVPQAACEVVNSEKRKYISEVLKQCHSLSGALLFDVEEMGNSLSITIKTPPRKDIDSDVFNLGNGNSNCSWEEAGIKMHEVEAGTAYHVPEGILAVYGSGIKPDDSRSVIKTDKVKSFLLDLAFQGAIL